MRREALAAMDFRALIGLGPRGRAAPRRTPVIAGHRAAGDDRSSICSYVRYMTSSIILSVCQIDRTSPRRAGVSRGWGAAGWASPPRPVIAAGAADRAGKAPARLSEKTRRRMVRPPGASRPGARARGVDI